MTETCAMCAYFKRDDHTDMKGRCRRNPAAIEKRADDWCGGFSMRAMGERLDRIDGS